MKIAHNNKITSLVQFFELLPEDERIIVDVLRQIISENLPGYCKEKLAFNVPYFYGKRGICIIWPAAIPAEALSKVCYLAFGKGIN